MPTFYDRFIQCAERWPTNVAVEVQRPDGLESYTFRELRRMAEAIARWLGERGIQLGQRVAILADNHPRWLAGYLGIIASGGTTVPLDTAYHADQVAKLLADSGSVLLFCDQKHFEVAQAAVEGTEIGMVLTDSGHSGEARQAGANFDCIFAQATGGFTPMPRAPEDL